MTSHQKLWHWDHNCKQMHPCIQCNSRNHMIHLAHWPQNHNCRPEDSNSHQFHTIHHRWSPLDQNYLPQGPCIQGTMKNHTTHPRMWRQDCNCTHWVGYTPLHRNSRIRMNHRCISHLDQSCKHRYPCTQYKTGIHTNYLRKWHQDQNYKPTHPCIQCKMCIHRNRRPQ